MTPVRYSLREEFIEVKGLCISYIAYELYVLDWIDTHSSKEFDGQEYVSYPEFLDNEYLDKEYITSLLLPEYSLIRSYEKDLERRGLYE